MITKKIKLIWIIIICVGLCLCFNALAFAQSGMSNARSVAMGGAYSALARGVESPAWNPANLALSAKKKYHLNLFSVGLGINNNSFSKKQYDLYNGKFLTEKDKLDILTSIPDEGINGNLDTEVQALGFAIGNFAFSASGLGASDFTFSKDVAELALNGNEIDRVYNIGNTRGEGWGISSYGVSVGFPLSVSFFQEFAVGVSIKYLKGHVFGKVVEAESSMLTNINGVHGSGKLVLDHSLGGNGFSLDIGSAALVNQNWAISFGISNLVNKISWNNDNERFTYTFTADSISVEKIEDTDIDSVYIDSDETEDIDSFSSTLPSQMRIGVARMTERLTLTFDYVQGFKKSAGVTSTPRLAFGSEFRFINFLPLRAGMAFGGKSGFSTSAGFAFDFSFFSWDFAISNKGGVFSGKGLALAFGWMFRF